jgi:hypothetical protein
VDILFRSIVITFLFAILLTFVNKVGFSKIRNKVDEFLPVLFDVIEDRIVNKLFGSRSLFFIFNQGLLAPFVEFI